MHQRRSGSVVGSLAVISGEVNLGNGIRGENAADIAPVGMGATMRAWAWVVSLAVSGRGIRRVPNGGAEPKEHSLPELKPKVTTMPP